jgi:hypothetical protein
VNPSGGAGCRGCSSSSEEGISRPSPLIIPSLIEPKNSNGLSIATTC